MATPLRVSDITSVTSGLVCTNPDTHFTWNPYILLYPVAAAAGSSNYYGNFYFAQTNMYTDNAVTGLDKLKIQFWSNNSPQPKLYINAGDKITISYIDETGVARQQNVYLPKLDIIYPTYGVPILYVASDGATYYDEALTQIAQPAPGVIQTGTIAVNVNLTNAYWTIAGPQSYNGTGSANLLNVPVGAYTITYSALAGYTTPPSQTLTLTAGQTITFIGNYTVVSQTGTIQINVNLAGAAWNITGQQNYNGIGSATIADAPVGNYTIIYSAVTGYTIPSSETYTLTVSQTITFTGNYSQAQEGFFGFRALDVNRVTQGTRIHYLYDIASGTWSPSAPVALPGETLVIIPTIVNSSTLADYGFYRAVDRDTGTEIPNSKLLFYLESGAEYYLDEMASVIMLDKNWNIRLEAGHLIGDPNVGPYTEVLDSIFEFTIAKEAVGQEGEAELTTIKVKCYNREYNYDVASKQWSPEPPKASQGEGVIIDYQIRNKGAADILFGSFYDNDTGSQIVDPLRIYLESGQSQLIREQFDNKQMPNKNWNIRLEAGHEEGESGLSITSIKAPQSVDYWEAFDVECTIMNVSDDATVYVRLVDNDHNYIINQTSIPLTRGQSQTVKFLNVHIACDTKNMTVECGRLE